MSAYPHLKSRPKLSATFLARVPHPHTPHYASQRPRAYLRPRKSSVHTEGQVRRPVPTRHNIFARDGRCIRRHTHTHTHTPRVRFYSDPRVSEIVRRRMESGSCDKVRLTPHSGEWARKISRDWNAARKACFSFSIRYVNCRMLMCFWYSPAFKAICPL